MIITTTETVPGKDIAEVIGIARGSMVRAKNIGSDFLAGIKNVIGGEIDEYTKLQSQARDEAIQRLINDALHMEADAVVNVRIATSMVMQGASEILAYGTAVKFPD